MDSRGRLNAMDESTNSVGSEVRQEAQLARQYLAAAELALMPDDAILQRSLTVKSIISTSSSFARRSQQAVGRPDLQRTVQIGLGLQGIIFEQVRRSLAMK
jgi:hypothetical protein